MGIAKKEDGLYFAGGRKYLADTTNDNTTFTTVKKTTVAGGYEYEFTLKFKISEAVIAKSIGNYDDLKLPPTGNVEDMINLLVIENAFTNNGKDANDLLVSNVDISLAAEPIDAVESDSNIRMQLLVSFKGGGKTDNGKTDNAMIK